MRPSNPPVSEYMHSYILHELRLRNIATVLDVGGTGKLNDRGFVVTNANIKSGVDGTKLPFDNNSFDATVSIATLEHIECKLDFLSEAIRVASDISLHWFPSGKHALRVEDNKRKLGHIHPCSLPAEDEIRYFLHSKNLYFSIEQLVTCREHLLLLAAHNPRLNVHELYEYIFEFKDEPYGCLLKVFLK